MGLATLINKNIEAAFNTLGTSSNDGVQQTVTYHHITTKGAYNRATGKLDASTESVHTLDAILYQERNREIDGIKIDVNESRLVFPSSRLPIKPDKDDYCFVNNTKFNIVNAYQDPAKATWTLHLRGT